MDDQHFELNEQEKTVMDHSEREEPDTDLNQKEEQQPVQSTAAGHKGPDIDDLLNTDTEDEREVKKNVRAKKKKIVKLMVATDSKGAINDEEAGEVPEAGEEPELGQEPEFVKPSLSPKTLVGLALRNISTTDCSQVFCFFRSAIYLF